VISRKARRGARLLLALALTLVTGAILASSAPAVVPQPAWRILGVTAPTNLPPATGGGGPGAGNYVVYVTNVGGASSAGAVELSIGPFPSGITTTGIATGLPGATPWGAGWSCQPEAAGTEVSCERTAPVAARRTAPTVVVPLAVAAGAAASSTVQVAVEGGGALADPSEANRFVAPVTVSAAQAPAGIQAFWAGAFDEAGKPATAAGGHPANVATGFLFNTKLSPAGEIKPVGDLKDLEVQLPPGFIGNPTITPRCPQYQLIPIEPSTSAVCPESAVIGTVQPSLEKFNAELGNGSSLYNDEPPFGSAAEFTFPIANAQSSIVGALRSSEDFGITALAPNAPVFFWVYGAISSLQGQPAGAGGKAFFTNSTDCAEQAAVAPVVGLAASTWQQPSAFDRHSIPQPPVTGCDGLEFGTPQVPVSFAFQPGSSDAATGVGASAHLHIDQAGLTDPSRRGTPHLKKSVVALPEGLDLNPAAANGLEACSEAQIGLITTEGAAPNRIRFDMSEPQCPDGSKIGTAEIETPLLEETLKGTIYLAAQDENPFHSLLALYLVVDNPRFGVVVKLPGEVKVDPQTGQLTASFDDNPQLPFEDLTLHFRGGPEQPRSTLATPDVCGKYTTAGEWTPWSAPESGPPAKTEDSFEVTKGVGGSGACPATKAARPFDLGFSAGTTDPSAGAHSPFTLRLTRPDGNQELDKVSVVTPPGFAASFKGVGTCSDAAISAAAAPGRTGKEELANPSCPASSQIGTTTVAVGVGSSPLSVKTGKAYLTGPYKGAPLSFTFIVPAVAGPFDLGVQVVKTAVYIDSKTARVTAVSDAIPQILKGIPLLVREIRVDIDRPGFTLNPTSCEPMAVLAQVGGASGAVANLSNRFQAANCGALAFHPGLKLQLHGGTKRGKYQRLEATVTYPDGPGYANIARAAVTLPHSEFLAQEHIRTVCTRVQFAAKACPPGSIYGHAEAITPLLDEPLTGPVYLRSSDNPLPDLVAALRGPDSRPIEIELAGRTDSKNGGIRNTFDLVPDAPVTKFTLQLFGGKKSLIVNSRNLCGAKQRATVRLNAQNGLQRNFRPLVRNDCGAGHKKKHPRHA
jgi:hypothetical protein